VEANLTSVLQVPLDRFAALVTGEDVFRRKPHPDIFLEAARRLDVPPAARCGKNKHKPRRWVVERTLGWLSKCRAILVRYDKNDFNYLGLIQFACSLLWYRRVHCLTSPQPLLRYILSTKN